MPGIIRLLPFIRQHALIRHGIFLTTVLPFSAAVYSLYHSAQSPFCMFNKPFESWNSYEHTNQKYYTTHDLKNYQVERPHFEYPSLD